MPVSLNSTLATAHSALVAHQAGMQVVADNIANATTAGYSRKRAETVTGPSQLLPEGVFGTGILVRDVTQLRDRFLDASFRDASSSLSHQQVRYDYLEQVEAAFAEPDNGLAGTLDGFWNSWSDLASDPLNHSARSVIRERGRQLIAQVQRLWNSLEQLRVSANRRLDAEVDRINQLTADVARLNEQIVATEAGGQTAGSLRDERDRAVDELAELAAVQVIEHETGSITVAFDGLALVDGSTSQQLTHAQYDGTQLRLYTAKGAEYRPAAGALAGYLAFLNDDLPTFRARFDQLVENIVTSVNTEHRKGTNPNGQQVDFFTTSGVSGQHAASLSLAPEVAADAMAIAAGSGAFDAVSGTWNYLSGTNDVASGIAGLRNAADITTFHADLVTEVATRTRSTGDRVSAQSALVEHAANRRDSYMGVATDEELIELIQLQQAYSAAARVITAADEMLQTLLDIKR